MSRKTLILNGSPRKGGNTDIALREMKEIFAAEKDGGKWNGRAFASRRR